MKKYLLIIQLVIVSNILIAQLGVNIKKIETIYIEIAEGQDINKGSLVSFTIKAKLKNGKIKDITSSDNLDVSGKGVKRVSSNKILILPSADCNLKMVKIDFALEKKDRSVNGHHELNLKFTGDINIDLRGNHGGNGLDGKNGAFKGAIFKSGSNGTDGGNGKNGEKGKDIKLFIVQDSVTKNYRVNVLKEGEVIPKCYISKDSSPRLIVNLSGGNGGNGGNAADGKDGDAGRIRKNGKQKNAGIGGNGGNGGHGGDGGDGGSVEFFLHKDVAYLNENIVIINNGGAPGGSGASGKAGLGGVNVNGSKMRDGQNGLLGKVGNNGLSGRIIKTQIVEDYDFKLSID